MILRWPTSPVLFYYSSLELIRFRTSVSLNFIKINNWTENFLQDQCDGWTSRTFKFKHIEWNITELNSVLKHKWPDFNSPFLQQTARSMRDFKYSEFNVKGISCWSPVRGFSKDSTGVSELSSHARRWKTTQLKCAISCNECLWWFMRISVLRISRILVVKSVGYSTIHYTILFKIAHCQSAAEEILTSFSSKDICTVKCTWNVPKVL